MDRRELIKFLSALGLLSSLPELSLASSATKKPKSLIVIFQRGAVDGLAMVSPYGDANFTRESRPGIYVAPDKLIKLDSFFGLHPAMASFKPLWEQGVLGVVHQVGSPSSSRSHFDSQDFMESGTPDVKSTENGFLARAALQLGDYKKIKLSSLCVQPNIARSISGEAKSLSFDNLNGFSIRGLGLSGSADGFEQFFESALDEVLKGQNKNSVSLLEDFALVKQIKLTEEFPKGQLSNRLKDIAKIIKAGMHIPFVITEAGGWDTHVNQGNEEGSLSTKLKDFSEAISCFVKEIGSKIEDVTIVTITEFGRTVKENGSKGTDHGHGSAFFVINGAVKSKNIITNWKDLKKENLFEGRDLPVTTDYRSVFSEILSTQFDIKDSTKVFPGFSGSKKVGLFRT